MSSTYVDLADARAEVIRWIEGVFGLKPMVMETFGSDADPPVVASVKRVRECDLFIGIYANRYGTVDPTTGKSITELELDEANLARSEGTLRDIFLYQIEPYSSWLAKHSESDAIAQSRLRNLMEKVSQHTRTSFKAKEDLLFVVVRDVQRFTIQWAPGKPEVRPIALPQSRLLAAPPGMQFLTSEARDYLIGREEDLGDALDLLKRESLVLLLGNSGVGKTSLIHAGLVPAADTIGWRAIYVRSLGYPHRDIINQLLASVFSSSPHLPDGLLPALAQVAAAVPGDILLIIDQFEDVLVSRDPRQTQELISALRQIREASILSVRLLVSYRAGVEGRLGAYWQEISGSPSGLPRIYLNGIDTDQAWEGVVKAANDLSVGIALQRDQIEGIKNDLATISVAAGCRGVYPPYIQMLVEHMWSAATRQGVRPYEYADYEQQSKMEGIVGSYLTKQLEYVTEKHDRRALVSLVRSHGAKVQVSLAEIAQETRLSESECEAALERLIRYRLVRHIEEYYEITHDLIAQHISTELIDPEEREFKRYRELLAAKAAAYGSTGNILTVEESLMLFRHREKIVPNDREMHLLLISWVRERVPGLYWLRNVDLSKLDAWLTDEWQHAEDSAKTSILTLRAFHGAKVLREQEYRVFYAYQRGSELAKIICENPGSVPKAILLRGLRHKREEVRQASLTAVITQIQEGDWSWLEVLRRSSSSHYRFAYQRLGFRGSLELPEGNGPESRSLREVRLLRAVARASSRQETTRAFNTLKRFRPVKHVLLVSRGIMYLASNEVSSLLKRARRASPWKAGALLGAIDNNIGEHQYRQLLVAFENWNQGSTAPEDKCRALALAIQRTTSQEHMALLRACMPVVPLTSATRELVAALFQWANVDDVRLLLDRIANAEGGIDFWNHLGLCKALEERMRQVGEESVPDFLRELTHRLEFSEYLDRDVRARMDPAQLLPVRVPRNRPLYVRVAAFAAIGLARRRDTDVLDRLVINYFDSVAHAAAQRLALLLQEKSLELLASKIAPDAPTSRAVSLAGAIRAAEITVYSSVEPRKQTSDSDVT